MSSLLACNDTRRLWSLWDIMNNFDAIGLCSALLELSSISVASGAARDAADSFYKAMTTLVGPEQSPPAVPVDAGVAKIAIDCLSSARDAAATAGLKDAEQRIVFILGRIKSDGSGSNYSSLPVELDHAKEAILSDLEKRKFLAITPARRDFCDNPNLLGVQVVASFPSALPDIAEAGNCLAADNNTAAVFHLMRAVEWALRALCVDLGFRRVKSKIKKSGRILYTPIEYSEWERILDELQDRVDRKIRLLKRGSRKQEIQQFYYPALQDIRGIRDAWRNHVMHTRDQYTAADADAILSHVQRLMNTLAARISEV
jgi:hypothetical protein